MSVSKVTISIDQPLLKRVDRLVRSGVFSNRSHIVQQAIEEKIARIDSTRLARECAKLHPAEEQALADDSRGRAHNGPNTKRRCGIGGHGRRFTTKWPMT